MGALILPSSGNIYVDTNSVISAVERIEPYRTLLLPLWQAAATGTVAILTSELTWLETLAKPLADKNVRLEELFRSFLTSTEVTMIPATFGTMGSGCTLA